MEYCNEYNGNAEEQCKQLKDLSESYYFVVCSAEKLNNITLAHKHQLGSALDRVNDIGKVIDKVTKDIKNSL